MIKRLSKQSGFSLIEVMIALAILSVIGIAYLGTMASASSAIMLNDGRTTAESLARSEIEYVKSQDYIDYSVSGHSVYDSLGAPENYILETLVAPFDPYSTEEELVDKLYSQVSGVYAQDNGIQAIIITITFFEEEESEQQSQFTLEGYKTQVR